MRLRYKYINNFCFQAFMWQLIKSHSILSMLSSYFLRFSISKNRKKKIVESNLIAFNMVTQFTSYIFNIPIRQTFIAYKSTKNEKENKLLSLSQVQCFIHEVRKLKAKEANIQ